jgi:hypothetical protein
VLRKDGTSTVLREFIAIRTTGQAGNTVGVL